MLTPSEKDANRKEELERRKANPEDWGPERMKSMDDVQKARKAQADKHK